MLVLSRKSRPEWHLTKVWCTIPPFKSSEILECTFENWTCLSQPSIICKWHQRSILIFVSPCSLQSEPPPKHIVLDGLSRKLRAFSIICTGQSVSPGFAPFGPIETQRHVVCDGITANLFARSFLQGTDWAQSSKMGERIRGNENYDRFAISRSKLIRRAPSDSKG
jgi:hypothetical protein